jgi:hypothetical protein
MMVPKKSLVLAGAALALFGASSSAQSQSGKVFARYNKPMKSVSLDLATGTITRGPAVNDRAGTTTIDFNNNDLGGFVGVDTGGGFCEWFDAGVKGFAGNNSDLMTNFVFAYCSSKTDVNSGGPGGSVGLGFYEGYVLGGGTSTTAAAVFTLTGLPANTGSSSIGAGGFSCFFINVTFGGGTVAFADGPIGYSWHFVDTSTDGLLAGTWPFLSCVVSCSGVIGQTDGQGMTDFVDQYCPPGNLRSTFTFGTTNAGAPVGSFTSVSMDIREVSDFPASIIAFNATVNPNPDILSANKPRIGNNWAGAITRPAALPVLNGATVSIRPSRIPLPNGVQGPAPLPTGSGGRILISGPLLSTIGTTATGNPRVRTFGAAIPSQLGLVNVGFCGQGTTLGSGVRVTSGIQGTTGTV